MDRIVSKVLLASALILAFPQISSAQILGGVAGDAKDDVEVSCGSCCSVRNTGGRKVSARLSLALGASATVIVGPGQSATWSTGGSCFSSGFGVFANYAD